MPALSNLILFMGLALAAPRASEISTPADHCVAYRTSKTMFFVSSSDVVGKNCDIAARALPELGGLYRIEVQIPAAAFKSGSETRDKDVAKLLHADAKANLTYRTQAFSPARWRELLAQKAFDVPGELSIGDKNFPLQLHVRYDDEIIAGSVTAHFQDYGLEPPKVGGGVVAKTSPDVELHVHLLASRILGADALRPSTKGTP